MPVTGIGGFFFRADDPGGLSAWYEKHLGIGSVWEQSAGTTAFSPFRRTSDYFPAEKQAMLNLRVTGLDTLMQALEAAGITVVKPSGDSEYGRFARIHDPEGNPIELWEPAPE